MWLCGPFCCVGDSCGRGGWLGCPLAWPGLPYCEGCQSLWAGMGCLAWGFLGLGGLTGEWVCPLGLMGWREDSRMALVSISVLVLEWAPSLAATSICVHRGRGGMGSQLAPLSLGSSPRSASGSHQGSLQTTAPALVSESCEILCAPCKSGVSVSYISWVMEMFYNLIECTFIKTFSMSAFYLRQITPQ